MLENDWRSIENWSRLNKPNLEIPMEGIWLNIGCGNKHLDGFINMDIKKPYDRKLDARKGLPYSDQSVDGIYSEHFFEHLNQAEGLNFLRECRRVLKPRGIVRIAMPDLDEVVHRYVSDDWRADGDMFKLGFDWVANRCEMLNIAMREWGHKHLYNEEELVRIAQTAGLDPIKRCAHGQSEISEFIGRETRNGSKLIMEFTVHDRRINENPLVSVLIPAYRATYFREALDSVLTQTYKNIEVIICDDSSDDEIEKTVNQLISSDNRVHYFRNDKCLGTLDNHMKCFSLAKGELIKFLSDDDLLVPTCIERMINVLRCHPSVTLVTSGRTRIDAVGKELPDIPATSLLSSQSCEIDGVSCANALISSQTNFIGEPSTTIFRKVDLIWVKPHFATFGGMMAVGAGDVAMWLNLLGRGNAYYIVDRLSFFRVHDSQRQQELPIQRAGKLTWKGFRFHGKRLGLMPYRLVFSIKTRDKNLCAWNATRLLPMPIFFEQFRHILSIKKAVSLV